MLLIVPVALTGVQVFLAFEEALSEPEPTAETSDRTSKEQQAESSQSEILKIGSDPGLSFYRNETTRQSVLDFYTGLTGSEQISTVILQYADKNDVPLSLAFSVAWAESRYKPTAMNRNSTSTDRGLFQLNNRSFPHLAEHQFWDPDINARHGLSYLRSCLLDGGNEVVALAMYNAGRSRVSSGGTPKMTLHYISHVLDYRNRLDQRFAESFLLENRRIAAGVEKIDLAGFETTEHSESSPADDSLPDSPTAVERLTMVATAMLDRKDKDKK